MSIIKPELSDLSPFAVGFRYPGEDIELEELKEVVKRAKRLRKLLQKRVKEFL